MVAGGQDVGQAGQVANFFHRRIAVRKFEQVEVGVRHQHVFSLAADPIAHVDITIGTTGARRVDRQADAGVLFLATAAATARHVEWHRNQVTDFQMFHVTTGFQHLASDFMTEYQPGLRRGAAAYHVLVRAADVGGDHAQDHAVFDALAAWIFHFRERN